MCRTRIELGIAAFDVVSLGFDIIESAAKEIASCQETEDEEDVLFNGSHLELGNPDDAKGNRTQTDPEVDDYCLD